MLRRQDGGKEKMPAIARVSDGEGVPARNPAAARAINVFLQTIGVMTCRAVLFASASTLLDTIREISHF